MDIRQLKYFVQVADSGPYSLASQKLFVSQPALSKTIKGIEEELGFTLFYSHQRRQYLTDRGQILYDKAVHLIKEYNSLMETAYDESGIEKGHLTIGMSGSTGSSSLFGHIYPGFAANHPMIDFTTVEKVTSILKEEIYIFLFTIREADRPIGDEEKCMSSVSETSFPEWSGRQWVFFLFLI